MNTKKKYPKTTYSCNPPLDCFNCPFPDCKRDGGTNSAETEYVKTAELSKGRHKSSFTLIADVIHSRPGGRRIV